MTSSHNTHIVKKEIKSDVRWLGPVFNFSGYASEAVDFLIPLETQLNLGLYHYNNVYSEAFIKGLDEKTRSSLFRMHRRFDDLRGGIVINHNPAPGFQILADAKYSVGRTMFETDRLPQGWVEACQKMNEIWVPSKFNYNTFADQGIPEEKLHVIPESVDTTFFNPAIHEPISLPNKRNYNFLSIFEWSSRKAWDTTLRSYLRAFTRKDDVCLYIRTYKNGLKNKDCGKFVEVVIKKLAIELGLNNSNLPQIEVLCEHIPTQQLPNLYKAVDCLVGVSRGEGWGRPQHEAMSMGLPVIATNWSGNTEFMNQENSFLIDYDLIVAKTVEPELWHYKNHIWSDPDEDHLVTTLRKLCNNPSLGVKKGLLARRSICKNYSRSRVSRIVIDRLKGIESNILTNTFPNGRVLNFFGNRSVETINVNNHAHRVTGLLIDGDSTGRGSLSYVNRSIASALTNCDSIKVLSQEELNSINYKQEQGISNFITLRHSWPPDWSDVKTGLKIHCQPWEYGSLPKDWIKPLNKADQIWANSIYVKNLYIDGGINPNKIELCPLGFDPKIFNFHAKPLKVNTSKKFKFLFVGGTIFRKGIDILLNAYINNFSKQDDVCLIVKDIGNNSFYQNQNLSEYIKTLSASDQLPEIIYIDSYLSNEEMASLYTASDCLVHPYRGEGFGLPVLEAMACGTLPIVTKGGSTDDFACEPYAWRISSSKSFIGTKLDNLELVEEGWLLEPNQASLASLMNQAFEQKAELHMMAKARSDYVHSSWTWTHTAKSIVKNVAKLLSNENLEVRTSKNINQIKPEQVDYKNFTNVQNEKMTSVFTDKGSISFSDVFQHFAKFEMM